MTTTTEILARLDRLTTALEKQTRRAPRAEPTRVPTFGEQVRARAADPCAHGEPRGATACPLCRRRRS